jgi:hypothetical protein
MVKKKKVQSRTKIHFRNLSQHLNTTERRNQILTLRGLDQRYVFLVF